MKNIFKYMIPCLAVAFGLTSCNSTMDDKAAIDAMNGYTSSDSSDSSDSSEEQESEEEEEPSA